MTSLEMVVMLDSSTVERCAMIHRSRTSDLCMAALDVSEAGTSVLVILRSASSKFGGLDDNGLAVVEAETPIFKAQLLLDEEALESLSTALAAAVAAMQRSTKE